MRVCLYACLNLKKHRKKQYNEMWETSEGA